MANFKDYGLTGVANTVQLGKQGGTVSYDVLSGRYALKQSNTSIYAATDVGSITAFNGGVIINDGTQRFEIDGTTISRLAANVISLDGDAAVRIPVGNDAARPTGEVGMIRVNTEGNSKFEFYDGNTWSSVSTGGSNGQLQFNSNGSMGGISSTSYDGSKLTLGSNSEVGITGGEAGQMLTTDGSGNLIWSTPNPGTVTSIDFSGGDTGLVTVGGPITSNGTITLGGTLNVANGGTGTTTSTGTGSVVLNDGATLISPNLGTPTFLDLSNATALNLETGVTGVLPMVNGGTGTSNIASGYVTSNGTVLSSTLTISGSDITGDISGNSNNVNGIVSIEHGGTGANTIEGAFTALAPSQANNAGKLLTTDGTTASWTSLGITNEIFVSKSGVDATANGSITNPFLTISAAINYLNANYPVASNSGTQFVIIVAPGTYNENVNINRLLTHLWAYEGKLKTTRISGTVTITSSVDYQGLFQNTVSLNNLFIDNTSNNAVQVTGSIPISVDINNCALYTSGVGIPFVMSNTATGGNRLRLIETDINAVGNASALDITNVTNGAINDINTSSAKTGGSAWKIANSVLTIGTVQLVGSGTSGPSNLLEVTGSTSIVSVGYSSFTSSTTNGNGIYIGTGARVLAGDNFYNIPLGTGYSVTGLAGGIYVRGGNQAVPGTNNGVNPVLVTLTMSTHVQASDLIGTVAIANGGTGANTKTEGFDALAPTTTIGDIIYYDGANNVRLGIGAESYVLTVANGIPTWANTGGGGGGTPGGLDTQIQFNDAGTFGGTANLTFDKTTSTFTIGGDTASNTSITGGTVTTATISSQPDTNLALVPGANGTVTIAAEDGGATGLELGTPTQGALVSNAVALTVDSTVSNAIAQLNQVLGKLIPPSPPNFPASQTLSITSTSTYRMTDYVQTDNTPAGNKNVAGGTTVTNVLRTSVYTTSNITNAGPGDSGTITAWVNGANTGSRTLTTSIDGNGTYGNLVIFNNADYSTVNSNVSSGFWYIFSTRAAGNVTQGWNEVYISSSAASNTNTPSWFYDSASPGTPQFTSTSITAPVSPSLTYSSTVPHYNSSTSFAIQFNVNRLSGNTYPTTDTFVTGTAGGAFSAPTSVTYATAGVTTPLAPNLYVASGSHTVNTAASIISGFGSSSSGPSVSVNNSYATGSTSFSPGATVLYKTGTTSSASRIEETNIFVGSTFGVGSGQAFRIINPGSTNTPAFTASAAAFNSQTSTLETYDATVVANVLKHDVTNYSIGYLPAGPNLSSGRSGTQYFTFKIVRSSVSKFDIGFTGTVAGMWVALPGSTIDSTSTLNGWIDMSVAYAGAGAPGANIAAGGNGSNGCALGGPVPLNAAQSNKRFTCTFGTVSSSSTATNEIYIRIALTSGQTVTALTLQTASN